MHVGRPHILANWSRKIGGEYKGATLPNAQMEQSDIEASLSRWFMRGLD
jgi:hypothetical protein